MYSDKLNSLTSFVKKIKTFFLKKICTQLIAPVQFSQVSVSSRAGKQLVLLDLLSVDCSENVWLQVWLSTFLSTFY